MTEGEKLASGSGGTPPPQTSCWRENNAGNRRGEKQGGPWRALDVTLRSYSNVFNRGGVED